MKLKLDENVPRRALAVVAERGHEVATVVEQGLAGHADADIAEAARREDRMLVTLDRGFADIRRYVPGTHPGVLVLRLRDQRPAAVEAALRALLDLHDLDSMRGCTIIVEPGNVRVRRAPAEPAG